MFVLMASSSLLSDCRVLWDGSHMPQLTSLFWQDVLLATEIPPPPRHKLLKINPTTSTQKQTNFPLIVSSNYQLPFDLIYGQSSQKLNLSTIFSRLFLCRKIRQVNSSNKFSFETQISVALHGITSFTKSNRFLEYFVPAFQILKSLESLHWKTTPSNFVSWKFLSISTEIFSGIFQEIPSLIFPQRKIFSKEDASPGFLFIYVFQTPRSLSITPPPPAQSRVVGPDNLWTPTPDRTAPKPKCGNKSRRYRTAPPPVTPLINENWQHIPTPDQILFGQC